MARFLWLGAVGLILLAAMIVSCTFGDVDDASLGNCLRPYCATAADCRDYETEAECRDFIRNDCGSDGEYYSCLCQCMEQYSNCGVIDCELECSDFC